ncbi:hypothetical protein EYF80_061982 [Liparis tanakae]|uniref:Uncharacterized protein n=1 Tax=Liparis tanakae TaxID=230148 RepID=A0A4Z2EH45_9TELE|nr:hypothetical protein EYF80_061982 [Liparis tanakae]
MFQETFEDSFIILVASRASFRSHSPLWSSSALLGRNQPGCDASSSAKRQRSPPQRHAGTRSPRAGRGALGGPVWAALIPGGDSSRGGGAM